MVQKRRNPPRRFKKRPKSVKSLVEYINKKKPIDQRTLAARSVAQVKEAVQTDLDTAAICLLQEDVANAATIQAMALKAAFKDPSAIINPDGSYHKALGSYLKFAQAKRAALTALKKFQDAEREEPKDKDLGQLIIECTNDTEE